jgi:hypothetical protein
MGRKSTLSDFDLEDAVARRRAKALLKARGERFVGRVLDDGKMPLEERLSILFFWVGRLERTAAWD